MEEPSSTSTPKKPIRTLKAESVIDWRMNLQNANMPTKWEYLLERELFADTTFLIGEKREPVKCHSLVLKLHSRVFETLLAGDKHDLEISTCSPGVFRHMLKYLYTDQLDVKPEDAMDLLILAKRYHLNTLQRKCGQIVLKGIDTKNAASLLNKAELVGDKELGLKAQEFIIQHAKEVLFTEAFSNLKIACLEKLLKKDRVLWNIDEVSLLDAIKRWATAECLRENRDISGPNQYKVAKPALDLIKFEKFTAIQFTSAVVKSNLLPHEMMLRIQSELIEKEEAMKSGSDTTSVSLDSPHSAPEHHQFDSNSSDAGSSYSEENALVGITNGAGCSLESSVIAGDLKHGVVHILKRYSCLAKDYMNTEYAGIYKISFAVSKSVNLSGVALYGRNNAGAQLVDIMLQIMPHDEQSILWDLSTKSILPVDGGEFDVMFESPVTIKRPEWYTILVSVNERVFPYGSGGKKNHVIDCGPGKSVEFYFKNSVGISGASFVRGQLPKIYFTLDTFST